MLNVSILKHRNESINYASITRPIITVCLPILLIHLLCEVNTETANLSIRIQTE